MMTIILSVCLVADPKVCKDQRMPLDGVMSTTECAMSAPPFFARWSEEHPGWRVVRWKCQSAAINDT